MTAGRAVPAALFAALLLAAVPAAAQTASATVSLTIRIVAPPPARVVAGSLPAAAPSELRAAYDGALARVERRVAGLLGPAAGRRRTEGLRRQAVVFAPRGVVLLGGGAAWIASVAGPEPGRASL